MNDFEQLQREYKKIQRKLAILGVFRLFAPIAFIGGWAMYFLLLILSNKLSSDDATAFVFISLAGVLGGGMGMSIYKMSKVKVLKQKFQNLEYQMKNSSLLANPETLKNPPNVRGVITLAVVGMITFLALGVLFGWFDKETLYTSKYVIDKTGKLNNEAIQAIDEVSKKLHNSIGAEIYIIVEKGNKNTSASEKSSKFFDENNVSSNGIVICYIIPHTYGMTIGTDTKNKDNIKSIVTDDFESHFDKGRYSDSVMALVNALWDFYRTSYEIKD